MLITPKIQYSRISYLPFLLPRLHAFFASSLILPELSPHEGWFSFENVPLKWHYPLGLLYDLFSGSIPGQSPSSSQRDLKSTENDQSTLPWRLTLHFGEWPDEQLVRLDPDGKVLHDAFINSVKEADFLRNGTAKGIMSLSKDDSTQLWNAVEERKPLWRNVRRPKVFAEFPSPESFTKYNPIIQKLLNAQGAPLRHIPIKIYLPSSPTSDEATSGHLNVVQSLIRPNSPNSREPQTLGMVLYTLLPTLFPSRRTPILAKPILHGAVVPMGALVEDLMRTAAYLDGWIHLGVVMMG